ncbi:MAG: hypothetical protein ACLT8E_05715 [Akkermansia sp.]
MTTFPGYPGRRLPGGLPVFTRIPAILQPVSCALATSWALTVAQYSQAAALKPLSWA